MKKIILIVFIFMSVNTFAEEGKLDLSISSSLSTGTGFGIAYNLTDNLRVKVASIYIGLFGKDSDEKSGSASIFSIGGSLSLKLKTLKDKKSSLYMFLGTSNFMATSSDGDRDNLMNIVTLGLGLRKFFDSKMFCEIELGYSLYFTENYDGNTEIMTLPSTGLNIGYQF